MTETQLQCSAENPDAYNISPDTAHIVSLLLSLSLYIHVINYSKPECDRWMQPRCHNEQ